MPRHSPCLPRLTLLHVMVLLLMLLQMMTVVLLLLMMVWQLRLHWHLAVAVLPLLLLWRVQPRVCILLLTHLDDREAAHGCMRRGGRAKLRRGRAFWEGACTAASMQGLRQGPACGQRYKRAASLGGRAGLGGMRSLQVLRHG